VKTFTGRSITTEQWLDHLYQYFAAHGGAEKTGALDSIDFRVRNYCFIVIHGPDRTEPRRGLTERVLPYPTI
jgi:hypothetical protein